ncbi:MAG: zinc ribbon domain-containing protein [Bacteroidales bacterium]|nr:zinc ribbon domain-containing protein [Candidatus Cryptobacteroides choladohippi]
MAEEFDNLNQQNAEAQEAKAETLKEKAEEFKEAAKEKAEETKAKAEETFEKVKADMDDLTGEMDPEDINRNKVFAVLSYIGILVLIPIFCAKESRYARFHANQGLVLFLAELVCGAVAKILLRPWAEGLVSLVFFALAIMGIVYSVQGKAKELPVLGNIKLLK